MMLIETCDSCSVVARLNISMKHDQSWERRVEETVDSLIIKTCLSVCGGSASWWWRSETLGTGLSWPGLTWTRWSRHQYSDNWQPASSINHCTLPDLVDHLNIGGHKSISWQCDIGVPNESIKYLYRRNRWNHFNMICILSIIGWWN